MPKTKPYPLETRAEVLAKYWLGAGYKELAEEYGIKEATISTWVTRVRQQTDLKKIAKLTDQAVYERCQRVLQEFFLVAFPAMVTLVKSVADEEAIRKSGLGERAIALEKAVDAILKLGKANE